MMPRKRKTSARAVKGETASRSGVPWYRTPEAVADRKEKSRRALLDDGGRELRAIRLDREAHQAFQLLQAHSPDLDNGAIVRKALVEAAQRTAKKRQR
jgi:hypothetical protein